MQAAQRSRVIATVWRARLRSRSPARLSRCRVRWPPLASSGATPSQRGECGFAADAAAVGLADQKLGGDYGADAGFGEQRRSGSMLR